MQFNVFLNNDAYAGFVPANTINEAIDLVAQQLEKAGMEKVVPDYGLAVIWFVGWKIGGALFAENPHCGAAIYGTHFASIVTPHQFTV
jgi:hypothetical protein